MKLRFPRKRKSSRTPMMATLAGVTALGALGWGMWRARKRRYY